MKLSMLKLLMTVTLLSTSLIADKTIDENILKFEKNKITSILKRQKITLNDVSIVLKKDLKNDGWYGYVFNLTFTVKGKVISQKDILFTNGALIAPELMNTKTKRSYKDIMYPMLGKKYFDKKHLIAGNENAKHTLVLFSDPLCPICIDEVPSIIKNVIDNPENIALYYYHLPLNMHPTARTLSKASMIATTMGIKDVEYEIYKTDFGALYDAYKEKDDQVALTHFNTVFKTNITMSQINDSSLNERLEHDNDLSTEAFVNGTPTLFLDGEMDQTRIKYLKYLK
ncbi:MAG: thiol:disulfide interchange protein DsbC [Arcobacteraceae bacterium]|jgi:thiol:disulfide interchange protein DsbC